MEQILEKSTICGHLYCAILVDRKAARCRVQSNLLNSEARFISLSKINSYVEIVQFTWSLICITII